MSGCRTQTGAPPSEVESMREKTFFVSQRPASISPDPSSYMNLSSSKNQIKHVSVTGAFKEKVLAFQEYVEGRPAALPVTPKAIGVSSSIVRVPSSRFLQLQMGERADWLLSGQ